MIDFHTHILPGMDDGSPDIRVTEAMLREEGRQGVDLAIATPHFYADRMTIDRFLERRNGAIEETGRLQDGADASLPTILAGAEVYYFQGIGAAKGIERLCVGQTRTLLLELPFEQWRASLLRDVEDLIEKRRLNVVLAHIERYPEFQKDKGVWQRLMALPVTGQINAGSLVRKGGFWHRSVKHKFSMKYLSARDAWIVSSDCHNMTTRRPNLSDAIDVIKAELGPEALERMEATLKRVLE